MLPAVYHVDYDSRPRLDSFRFRWKCKSNFSALLSGALALMLLSINIDHQLHWRLKKISHALTTTSIEFVDTCFPGLRDELNSAPVTHSISHPRICFSLSGFGLTRVQDKAIPTFPSSYLSM